MARRAGNGCENEKGFVEKGGRNPDDDVILKIHNHDTLLGCLGESLVTQKETEDRAKAVEERRQAQGGPYRSKGITLGPAYRRRYAVEPRDPPNLTRWHIKFGASQELSRKAKEVGGTQD
jgi:hypothetical protein